MQHPSTFHPDTWLHDDAYVRLHEESRGIRRDDRTKREAWVQTLSADRREALFELEILLKSTACFASQRNHPGKPRRVPLVAQDFRLPLWMFSKGLCRMVQLVRLCLGPADKAFMFNRYLETLLPDDTNKSRLLATMQIDISPENSLLSLLQGLTNVAEVSEGLLRSNRIPYQLFRATMSLVRREVARNSLFNPLATLEFRPEFDRIPSTQVMSILYKVHGSHVQRLAALAFLSLFRMLSYLRLLEQCVLEVHDPQHISVGRVYLVLSVLRSDGRALSNYLRRNCGTYLAAGYDDMVLGMSATQVSSRYEDLRQTGTKLVAIRTAFEAVSANVRLELRKSFKHDVSSPQRKIDAATLRQQLQTLIAALRPAFQHSIVFLAKSLDPTTKQVSMFDDAATKCQLSQRLREHVWMFAQIVRVFMVKAHTTTSHQHSWVGVGSLHYVQEFLAYFVSMGYSLVKSDDYPRLDAFVAIINELKDVAVLDTDTLARLVHESEAFYAFLMELLDRINQRAELRNIPFEEAKAARNLRHYLQRW